MREWRVGFGIGIGIGKGPNWCAWYEGLELTWDCSIPLAWDYWNPPFTWYWEFSPGLENFSGKNILAYDIFRTKCPSEFYLLISLRYLSNASSPSAKPKICGSPSSPQSLLPFELHQSIKKLCQMQDIVRIFLHHQVQWTMLLEILIPQNWDELSGFFCS